MAVNLSSLSNLVTAAGAFSNLILINPQKDIGITAQDGQDDNFLFNYEGENTITLESDITDHYTENNSPVQDHIALKPVMITVHGFIGELNDITPKILGPLRFLNDKLSDLAPYAPEISKTAQLALNNATQIYNAANNVATAAVSTVQNILGSGSQNKQQQAFVRFYSYWQNRQLFQVQTPWVVLKNMAIKSLRAVQDEETRIITDFEITFKEVNYASTGFLSAVSDLSGQGRFNSQNATETNLGTGATSPGPAVSTLWTSSVA